MNTSARRPHMRVSEFEELARCAYSAAEKLRLEFLGGRLGAGPRPDGNRSTTLGWLQRLCQEHRPELSLHPSRGLKVEARGDAASWRNGTLSWGTGSGPTPDRS
ncbi:hypothetical protein [Streptomyces sp. Ru73]|uniref:hypothetical protein n=1 Tax=Streptomyces sp. Ru73 TaxID=2080748 RepID=UPI00267A13F9|nr:hypothetical protein [Streptomyces sp. Ru73]